MSMMKKFDKDFVSRTMKILDDCSGKTEYEVTLLLNCLLALVTLPIERNKITKKVKQEDKMIEFQRDCVNKIEELRNEKDYINNNKEYFFNNIRNAIAHLHIELEEGCYRKDIENIILRNALDEDEFKNKNYNLQLNISVNNLMLFAKYVAEEYLKRFF